MLILLSGRNRSGKTHFGRYLRDKYGFKLLMFSDLVKKEFCEVYGCTIDEVERHKNFFRLDWKMCDLKKIDSELYNKIAEEIGLNDLDDREQIENDEFDGINTITEFKLDIEPDYWFKKFIEEHRNDFRKGTNLVICDCRFERSIYLTRNSYRGRVVTLRVNSKKCNIIDRCGEWLEIPLETQLDNYIFNEVVDNNGTLEEYEEKIKKLCKKWALKSVRRINFT